MNGRIWALFVVGAIALGLGIVAFLHRHRFRFRAFPLDDPRSLDALASDGWELRRLGVPDGGEIHGLIRHPASSDAAWLLFFPGNAREMLAAGRRLLGRWADGLDLGLVVWCYRGFDSSDGEPSRDAFYADADRIWADLTADLGVSPARIHIVGYSMGTAVASRLVAALTERGEPPVSLTLVAGSPELDIVPNVWYRSWLPSRPLRPIDFAPRVGCPVLLIHGEDDSTLSVDEARSLTESFVAPASLLVVPGRGHADILEDDVAIGRLRDFIGQ